MNKEMETARAIIHAQESINACTHACAFIDKKLPK